MTFKGGEIVDKQSIEKYISKREKFSIPEIQSKFSLTYKEVRGFFRELEDSNKIKLDDDINYTFCLEDDREKKIPPKRMKSFFNTDDEENERREALERRRLELIRRMESVVDDDEEDDDEDEDDDFDIDSLFDEDDNDEDDDKDERTVEKIKNDVLNKISDEFDVIKDDDMREAFAIAEKESREQNTTKKVVNSFCFTENFLRIGPSKYIGKLGVTYPNDTEIEFLLYYEDGVFLSDNGLTYSYLSSCFNVEDNVISTQIKEIIDNYSISLSEKNDCKELVIRIRDEKSAPMSFLWLFSAIERIVNMKI